MIGGPSVLNSFLQKSGLPLDVTVRFQINMALGDLSGTTRAAKFSNMVLPMLWTEFVSNVYITFFYMPYQTLRLSG
jgi:hypothetical protein